MLQLTRIPRTYEELQYICEGNTVLVFEKDSFKFLQYIQDKNHRFQGVKKPNLNFFFKTEAHYSS